METNLSHKTKSCCNISIVTQAIQATRQNMESIAIAMRGKFIEIQARQQGQRTQQMAAIEEENEN